MAAYIALFFSLVSLILMIVILVRFKKLFSTDSIIEKTKSQMNRVITDVNANANRDMELINEASRRLRALLNEADKKMETFKEATQLLHNTIAEAEKAGRSHHAAASTVSTAAARSAIDPDASYRVRTVPQTPGVQQSLFDDVEKEEEKKSILKDETIVTKDGAAFKEVPVINATNYDEKMALLKRQKDAQEQLNQKSDRSLKEKVERLFNQGMQIDDIAQELSCPASEVQFIIDML